MPDAALLNSTQTTETIVEYDRSYGGSFDNPFGGAPSLMFNMHRVSVRSRDNKLLSADSLPNLHAPFEAGKTYKLYDPTTGSELVGQTFQAEQFYAMMYSVMRQTLLEKQAEQGG